MINDIEERASTEKTKTVDKKEIIRSIIKKVGKPKDMIQITVKNVYDNKYRLNIFVRNEKQTIVISDSYFLTVSNEGEILASTPELIRRY